MATNHAGTDIGKNGSKKSSMTKKVKLSRTDINGMMAPFFAVILNFKAQYHKIKLGEKEACERPKIITNGDPERGRKSGTVASSL